MYFFALTCMSQTVTLLNTVDEHALNHVSGCLEVLNVTKFLQELYILSVPPSLWDMGFEALNMYLGSLKSCFRHL